MSLLSYSGVTTKVRAMSGKLLTKDDYLALCSTSSVQEFVNYLKGKKPYETVFSQVHIESLHRGDIEKLLTKGIYADFSKIYRFSGSVQRDYLKLHFMKYQVEIIKSCLRMIFDKRKPELNLKLYQAFFLKHSNMDLVKLTSSTTISELVENLKGTVFYQPLSKLLPIEKPTLFDYELQLDLFYFVTIYKNCSKLLKGEDLELVKNSLGIQIDLLNIQWIYRAKKYLKLSNVDLYKIIIPIHHKIKLAQIQKLVEAESIEVFGHFLNTTYYGNKFTTLDNYSLEDEFTQLQEKINKTDSRKNPYSIAVIKSYLYNKEKEVKKLTTVLECVRYGYDPKQIEEYLKTEV